MRLPRGARLFGDDVDRNVLAAEERIGRRQHDARDQQIADELVGPGDRCVEHVAAHHRVDDRRKRCEQRRRR